jgi:DNA-binding MarR family transcriptional regulator
MATKATLMPEIIDNIRRVFKAVNDHSKKAEHETGITGPQLWTIKTISENSPINVKDLAARIFLHPATVVGIIDRLESKGLVRRMRSKDDRRNVEIELTESGRRLVAGSPEVAQGLLVRGLKSLSVNELENLADGLEKLVKILHAQELPPQLMLSPEINLPDEKLNRNRKSSRRGNSDSKNSLSD